METLWAYNLGGDRYRLDNHPFYAYFVSVGDIVHAPYDADGQFPTCRAVLEKSGNRTVRVISKPPLEGGNSSDQLMTRLVALGCNYEGANRSYFSVNVPSTTDLATVCDILTTGGTQWEHADPTYSELYPDDA